MSNQGFEEASAQERRPQTEAGVAATPSWTPGPWVAEFGDHSHRYVHVTDGDDRTIYYKYGSGTKSAADQDEANARLIAAAPALYGALAELIEALRREAPGTPLNNHRLDTLGAKATSALRQARGEPA